VQFEVVQPGKDPLVVDSQTVERGLGVGNATDLIVSVTPDAAGPWRLIARIDPTNQISEADESDNETALDVNVVQNEINLRLPEDGLTVAFDPASPRVGLFTISMTNTGDSTAVGPMSVKYFGLPEGGDSVEWGVFDFEIDLAPGAAFNQQVAYSVDPGTYRAYALADSGQVWAEYDEDDNEAFFDFTAP